MNECIGRVSAGMMVGHMDECTKCSEELELELELDRELCHLPRAALTLIRVTLIVAGRTDANNCVLASRLVFVFFSFSFSCSGSAQWAQLLRYLSNIY
jgi:hypothetical protein